MNPYLIGVIVSIIIYMVVGNLVGRSVKDVDDYYVSGRNAGTLLIAGTLIASMMSTSSFIGDTAWTYDGFMGSMLIINLGTCAGYVLGPLLYGRFVRRSQVVTMPEFFGKRFDSKTMHTVAGITAFIVMIAYLVAVTKGTSLLMMSLTGLSKEICLLLTGVCFITFSCYSGSKGVIVTDTMMFLVFLGTTLLAAPFLFDAIGGLNDMAVNVINNPDTPADVLSWHGPLEGSTLLDNVGYAIAVGALWICAIMVSPWQAGRAMMAKDEHIGIRAGGVAAIATVFLMTLLYIMGVSMNVLDANITPSEDVMIVISMSVVPTIVGVIMLTGVMSAGLSSASTFLSLCAFSATSDIVPYEFKSDKQQLRISRIIMLAVSIVAMALAYMDLAVLRVISWFAAGAVASGWTVVGLGAVWSKKLTARGAVWSMAGGFAACMIATILSKTGIVPLPAWIEPFYIGFPVSLLGAILGSMGQTPTANEVAYREKLHVVPASEKERSLFVVDRRYGYIMIAAGILATVLLLVLWALPVNSVT